MNHRPRTRLHATLVLRYRAILAYSGLTLALAGALMLSCLLAIPAYPAEWRHAFAFAGPGLLAVLSGGAAYVRLRPREAVLTVQEGGLIVLLGWAGACLVGACPLMAVERLTFTQALFESVSGWTTTGLSVVDVTEAARLTLIWRSAMQLVGGAGLAIVMLAALTGPAGAGLSSAEGRSDLLVPHVRKSAKLVISIYAGYVIAGVFAYRAARMDWFDAINHAFAAVSTGGFSTRPESIGYWDSPYVEAVSLALMFLGNLNFLTAYLLLRGRLRAAPRDGEIRLFAAILPAAALFVLLFGCWGLYPSLGKSIRVAIFETVSALTTTGFSTVGYSDWRSAGMLALIVLMLIGGGTCSTAGGIKQYRVFLLFKALVWEARRPLLPRAAVVEHSIGHGGSLQPVHDGHVRQAAIYAFLFLATWVLGTALLTTHGIGLQEALFEFASSLGTVGLSMGVTAPDAPPLILWAEMLAMFLGRLEFFVVFVGVAKLMRDLPVLGRPPARRSARS
jgi:trk system potassium uptake protein TrkH